jgi:hypothetical protein
MMSLPDLFGLSGISLSVYCYAKAQLRPGFTKRVAYSALNLSSALLLGVSLSHDWNLASFTSNTIWGVISLYGLMRSLKLLSRSHPHFARFATRSTARR